MNTNLVELTGYCFLLHPSVFLKICPLPSLVSFLLIASSKWSSALIEVKGVFNWHLPEFLGQYVTNLKKQTLNSQTDIPHDRKTCLEKWMWFQHLENLGSDSPSKFGGCQSRDIFRGVPVKKHPVLADRSIENYIQIFTWRMKCDSSSKISILYFKFIHI